MSCHTRGYSILGSCFRKHFSHIKTYFTWLERLSVSSPVFAVPQYSGWHYLSHGASGTNGKVCILLHAFPWFRLYIVFFSFSQSSGFATYMYELLGCRECISHNYWGPPNTAGKCMLSIINLVVVCPLVVYFTIGNYCFVSTTCVMATVHGESLFGSISHMTTDIHVKQPTPFLYPKVLEKKIKNWRWEMPGKSGYT